VLGFKAFLIAGELRLDYAERRKFYIDYLPHAIALGVVDKWTDRFSDVTDALAEPLVIDNLQVDVSTFGRRVNQFAKQVTAQNTAKLEIERNRWRGRKANDS
jgi:hypothetical protein